MGRQRKYPPHISLGSVTRSKNTAAQCGRKIYTDLIDTQLHSPMHLISGCLHPTQVSWLPVLTNVPPSLHHTAATHNLLQIIEAHSNWHVHADVFEHPPPRLTSRCPIWSDMAPVDTTTQWREDWSSASVVIHSIVTDPTIHNQVLISLVTHGLCSTVSGQAKARHANLHKWGLAQSPSCVCGQQQR